MTGVQTCALPICLFYQKFCGIRFGHDTEVSTGGSVNVQRLIFAEIVAVLFAPFLVLGGKGFLRQAADALVMHDGFLKLFDSFDKFTWRGEGSLRAWMERVMVNTVLQYLRKNDVMAFK